MQGIVRNRNVHPVEVVDQNPNAQERGNTPASSASRGLKLRLGHSSCDGEAFIDVRAQLATMSRGIVYGDEALAHLGHACDHFRIPAFIESTD